MLHPRRGPAREADGDARELGGGSSRGLGGGSGTYGAGTGASAGGLLSPRRDLGGERLWQRWESMAAGMPDGGGRGGDRGGAMSELTFLSFFHRKPVWRAV